MSTAKWLKHGMVAVLLIAAVTSCQGPVLIISPTELANVIVGNIYSRTLTADSEGDLLWRVSAGSLPTGLSLNQETGAITGTFTQDGTFTFTITVEEPGLFPRTGEYAFTLTVIPKLTLDETLDAAHQGEVYSDQFEVAGGVTPYTFELIGLPGGLSLDTTTGAITGTPGQADAGRTLQVTVTDSGDPQQTATAQTTFVIKPPPVSITTTTLPDGQVGTAYSQTLEAEDGFTPYTWSVTAGVLPPGNPTMRLDQSTGKISGTPTTADSWTFTITVTDDDSPETTDSQEFTIDIAP